MRGIPKSIRAALAICTGVGIVITAFAALFPEPAAKEGFWLPVAQAREMTRGHGTPSRFWQLKYKVISAVPPLRRWYYGRRYGGPYTVQLEPIFLNAPRTLPEDTDLDQPVATNSSGARVWIVPLEKLPAFYSKFLKQARTNTQYNWNQKGRIEAADGRDIFCTSRTLSTSYYSPSWSPPPPQWNDIDINLNAIKCPNAFDLKVAMTPIPSTGNTNSPFGFHTRAPIGSIVVVDCGNSFKNPSGLSCWFFIAPTDISAGTHPNVFYQ